MILQLITICFVVVSMLITLYYLFLVPFAFKHRERKGKDDRQPQLEYAILIPAHNEETTIYKSIDACKNLDYPAEKVHLFVVADNCTDHTAAVAGKYGITVLERSDLSKIGKGYAVDWGLKKILNEKFDALIILDAECSIDSQALNVFNDYFLSGEKVLQANDTTTNPDESFISYLVAVGNYIENHLFYKPKSRLGLAVFVRGTGVVFKKEILEQIPWQAHSVAEDSEYTLNLIAHDVSIKFIDEVKVASDFPVNAQQIGVQRSRWASGNLNFVKKQAWRLIARGIWRRNIKTIDAGVTLLVLSRPLTLLLIFLALLFSSLNILVVGNPLSLYLLGASIFIILGQVLYYSLGIALMGITKKRLGYLMQAPVVLIHLILISLKSLLSSEKLNWNKTPRLN